MTPLAVWAVSDGRAGIRNQVLGLAEAVGRLTPADVIEKRVGYRGGLGRWPAWLNLAPRLALSADADPIAPPWPDLWIAAGRATLPLSARVKRWSGGRTFVVQVQDPRWSPRLFDLVIAPRHDRLSGPNVVSILGSPNRITPERLAQSRQALAERLDALPSPRVAVLIGGKSKAFDLSGSQAAALGDQIVAAVREAGGSVLATFSRRTPAAARGALQPRLAALPGWIWDESGPNPYFAFLGAADAVLVTEDSTNMAVEAAATGAPVHVLGLEGGSPKFARLHDELRRHGAALPFMGRLEHWNYAPLRETDRAAAAVLERLQPVRANRDERPSL
jgi:hypothetical protein